MFGMLEMFEHLSQYQAVIVTGCHRAGTRITSRCIAYDTGIPFVGEEEFHNKDWKEAQAKLRYRAVLQAPGLFEHLKKLDDPERLFVWVDRPEEDRRRSEKVSGCAENRYTRDERWAQWLAMPLTNRAFVRYQSLEAHPLWVPQETRDEIRDYAKRNHDRICKHETEWNLYGKVPLARS